MSFGQYRASAGVALLILALVSCGGSASQEGMERLRQEVERLRAEVEQGGEENDAATAPPAILALFEQDATRSTLAGLQPGDTLAQARERFGQETRSRSWTSDGRPVFQYEWELEAGVLIRLNADGDGRLEKVGVALDGTQALNIPTLAGLRLGQETFASVREKFGATLETDLQLWSAQGLYTVAQRTPLAGTANRRLEFVSQMPEELSRAQLEQIGLEVQRNRNPAVLEPQLRDRTPFLVAAGSRPLARPIYHRDAEPQGISVRRAELGGTSPVSLRARAVRRVRTGAGVAAGWQ